jgi:hypothetical protein
MVQSFNFIRYVSANPASKLAQQFITALGDKDQTKAVNQFFADSGSFKQCTISTWSAVTGWQTQYLSPWQGSFYLYDASDNVQEIKLIAGVNITVSGGKTTAVLCMADANGKWSDASQQVNIDMNGGNITESNPDQGGISVSLTPLWMNVTQKQGDTVKYLIGPTLSGTVNNTKVMGNFQQLTTSGESNGKDQKRTDPSIWNELKQNVGMLISAGMLYIMYKQWQESKVSKSNEVVNKSQDPVREKNEIEERQREVEKEADKDMNNDMSTEVKNISSDLNSLPEKEQDVRNAERKLEAQDVLDTQKSNLQEILAEAPPSDAVQKIVDNMESAQDDLDNSKLDNAMSKLSEVKSNLQDLVENNQDIFSEEQKKAIDEVQDNIEEANKRDQDIKEVEEKQQERDAKDASEEFNDEDVDGPKSDPIEFGGGE